MKKSDKCIVKGNTPAELNKVFELGKGLSPKLRVNEMVCLFQNVTYIFCDYFDDDHDEHYFLETFFSIENHSRPGFRYETNRKLVELLQ